MDIALTGLADDLDGRWVVPLSEMGMTEEQVGVEAPLSVSGVPRYEVEMSP